MLAVSAALLPCHAMAQLQFEELPGRGLPLYHDLARAVAVGDLDGDGDLDMVVANMAGCPSSWCGSDHDRIYQNDGNGTFVETTATALPMDFSGSYAVALGDIDGDGDLDLAIGKGGNHLAYSYGIPVQNRLYLNDGTGAFTDVTSARTPAVADITGAIAFVDVDGDSDLDMVVGNGGDSGPEQNRLYINDGSGTFSDAAAAQLPATNDVTTSVAFGDVDGDGDIDLVFGNDGQNRLCLNDGSGTFVDGTNTHVPVWTDGTNAITLGDVDGDGDPDLAIGNGVTPFEQNRLYLNDGSGVFSDVTATQLPTVGDRTEGVSLADIDGDGDPDLVFGAWGQNRLYLNDGNGTFTDVTATRLPTLSTWWSSRPTVVFADIDDDGDPDLFWGDRLLVNHARHIDTPLGAREGHNYQLELYARGVSPGAVAVFPFVSFGAASLPIPPLGTLRIDAAAAFALPPALVPQPSGLASRSIFIPPNSGLVGITIHAQALWVQGTTLRLTNATADVIQP